MEHELAADSSGKAAVAVVNDRLNLGLKIVTRIDQLPCLYQWQHFQAGQYALGVEPSTHHVLGDLAARERAEMIWLEHDMGREYDVALRILDGREQISAAEMAIRAVASQPDDDYPPPTGVFAPLGGR